jgi:hypothetical protein
MARNASEHEYVSSKTTIILYSNPFSDQMKRHYDNPMHDVSRAIDLFEVAWRTQRSWDAELRGTPVARRFLRLRGVYISS